MGLQEKLNTMKKDSTASRPPKVVAVLHEEIEKLVKSGVAGKAIKSGEILPDFSLQNEKGNLVSSKDLLSQGPLIVSFYRGIW